jgi:hypothetical protein
LRRYCKYKNAAYEGSDFDALAFIGSYRRVYSVLLGRFLS